MQTKKQKSPPAKLQQGLFTVLKYIDNKNKKKGHVNFMKSQKNFIKKIKNNLTCLLKGKSPNFRIYEGNFK